jgi:hypothetical protein
MLLRRRDARNFTRLLAFSRDNNGGFNFGSTANTSDWAAG